MLVNVLSPASWAASGRSYDLSKAAAWSATNSMRLQLLEHGITVTALHVGPMDTEAVAAVDIPKSDPRDIARQTVDAIIAGRFEVLADQRSRDIKARLCRDLTRDVPAAGPLTQRAAKTAGDLSSGPWPNRLLTRSRYGIRRPARRAGRRPVRDEFVVGCGRGPHRPQPPSTCSVKENPGSPLRHRGVAGRLRDQDR